MIHESSTITPKIFLDLLKTCQQKITPNLNGILVNWYNPQDYIGFHSDDEKNLIRDEPIITLTLLEDP